MRTLWLLLAVCLLPFVASFLLYHFAPPRERMNYGELLTPSPLPEMKLLGIDGRSVPFGSLRGQWLLLHIDSAGCDRRCRSKLYKLRQVRLAQGKNLERVLRVWLLIDELPVDAALLREFEGTVVLRASAETLSRFPASADIRDHVWLVDPLGNLVLRYPPDADPSGIKRDLQRLLKVSRIG
jgi:hypothetical protein